MELCIRRPFIALNFDYTIKCNLSILFAFCQTMQSRLLSDPAFVKMNVLQPCMQCANIHSDFEQFKQYFRNSVDTFEL